MLRRLIPGLILCGCVMAAGCGVSASPTGLTPGFAEAAKPAHSYMASDLIPAIGTARFPDAYAASRARVKIVQSKVASEADQGVWLLLTMVNVKSNELNGARELAETMNLSPQTVRTMRESALDVASERDTCMSEAETWLTGSGLLVGSMKERPCLQQARLALAVLSKKK
jgi:hypothetical protein